jgi:hypothetical protein
MGIVHPDVALEFVVLIQGRDPVRGYDLRFGDGRAGGPDAGVRRLALEVASGKLGDVLGDSVQGRIALAYLRAARMVEEPAESEGSDVVDPLNGSFGMVITYSLRSSSK